jgi:hypothetical protein
MQRNPNAPYRPDYILYVDDAGDDTTKALKPSHASGNSEWLCIGGYLVRSSAEDELESRREELVQSIGGVAGQALHFRNYKAPNRLKISKKLSTYSARAFVVCSYKQTMVGYRNKRAEAAGTANSEGQYLYNWVTCLLLECVTDFIRRDALEKNLQDPKLKIIMASHKGHHFGHFKAYVLQLIRQATAQSTFIKTNEIDPRILSYHSIDRCPASLLPGLQLADAVVSATFQSIEQSSPGFKDSPAVFLKQLFAAKRHVSGGHLHRSNFGLTVFPQKNSHLFLNDDQKRFFKEFGYDFDWIERNMT